MNKTINLYIFTIIMCTVLGYFLYLKTENQLFLWVYVGLPFLSITSFINYKLNKRILILTLSILIVLFIFGLFAGEGGVIPTLRRLLLGSGSFILAITIFLHQKIGIKAIKCVFHTYSIMFIAYLFSNGISNPEIMNFFFATVSRNYISGFFILLLTFLMVSHHTQNIKLSPYYPIITLVFCFLTYGRSGIGISIGLLLIYSFKQFWQKKLNVYQVLFFFIILLSPLILDIILNYINQYSGFQNNLESPRSILFAEYSFQLLNNPSYIVLGRTFEDCCWLTTNYGGNPHNSFILGHAQFGIAHTLICIFIVYSAFKAKDLYIVMILLLIYVRSALDSLVLFNALDFVIWYIFFSTLKISKNNKQDLSH